MKKAIRLCMVLSLTTIFMLSCKSKQSVTEIPQGANIPAATTNQPAAQPVTQPESNIVKIDENISFEIVPRDEKFSLAEGEKNVNAFNKKYHVVVGSFKSQDNAKGLQRTLNTQGNDALIVVNEQGMFRVLIESFDDYREAHAKINRIKTDFPDAWVLIQKF
jgi:cell division protein FtsN